MKKIIRCLPFLLLLLLLCGASVQAANYKPGKVTGVTAKNVGETGFTLKWKKVSKATGYYERYELEKNRYCKIHLI